MTDTMPTDAQRLYESPPLAAEPAPGTLVSDADGLPWRKAPDAFFNIYR